MRVCPLYPHAAAFVSLLVKLGIKSAKEIDDHAGFGDIFNLASCLRDTYENYYV